MSHHLKSVCLIVVLLAVTATGAALADPPDQPIERFITAELGCFGPGLANSSPPCENVPSFLPDPDPELFVENVTGSLELTVFADDTAYYEVTIENVPQDVVMTAWITYCSPRPGGADDPETQVCSSPLVNPREGGRPSVPLQSLFAGFTNGLGPDPNTLAYQGDGVWKLEGFLEYNPLKAGHGPVVSGVEVNQAGLDGDLAQPPCCHGGGGGFTTLQPVAGGYLREFEEGGFQKLDENGLPVLVRSPLPTWIIPVIIHTDDLTHGAHSGGPGGGAYLVGGFLLCNQDTGMPHCM